VILHLGKLSFLFLKLWFSEFCIGWWNPIGTIGVVRLEGGLCNNRISCDSYRTDRIGFAAQNLMLAGLASTLNLIYFFFLGMPVWFVFAGGHGMRSVL
jgi:hypothetical protein